MGRLGIRVEVSASEREQLVAMSSSRALPHSLVRRAKVVLMAADGHSNGQIAAQCAITPPAVSGLRAHATTAADGPGVLRGRYPRLCSSRTTTLFAALNAATGEVFAQCKDRHRHQEFIAFLKDIERAVPAELELHLILDNYATHKHPKVKEWLAKHSRYHLHFTPNYSSWLNQVERSRSRNEESLLQVALDSTRLRAGVRETLPSASRVPEIPTTSEFSSRKLTACSR
jgi:transposase